MNKCAKCGTEFEGNFCPECGTPSQAPQKCPKCGAELKENIKFCNNCGYDFFEWQHVETRKPAVKHDFDWRSLLQYLPVMFFGLWAALLWAFYAAPIMKGDGFFIENTNLYQLLKDEMMSDMYAVARALISFAAISCAYSALFAFVQIKGGNFAKCIVSISSYLFYLVILICTIIIAVQFKNYVGDLEDVNGCFVAVVISLTAAFAVLQGAALLLCSFWGLIGFDEENIAAILDKIPDSIKNWFIFMR